MEPDENSDHLAPVRRKLLEKVIENVAFDGWSDIALRHAANACGIDMGMARLAFPNNVDLVSCYIDGADKAMAQILATRNLDEMRVRDRITAAVLARLDAVAGNREAERRAVAFIALPMNASTALRCLYNTVDKMWRICGDTSTDFNFYTKRAILAGVYSSTLLYWLSDESEGYSDTGDFLDRRIDNVMNFEKAKSEFRSKAEKMSEAFPSPLGGLGRRRFGASSRMKP